MIYQLISKAHPHISSSLKRLTDYHAGDVAGSTSAQKKLLAHISNTVPFYAELSARQLCELPVINKEIIRRDPEKFLSSRIRRDALYWGTTSGSTGEPLNFALDRRKKAYRTAEMIFYNGWAGYELGDRFVLNSVGAKKSRIRSIIQRCAVTDPSFFDEDWMETQRQMLIKEQPKLLVAYASTVKEFAGYCLERGDRPEDFALKGIICTSENLDENSRRLATQVFGCPVLSRYSSLETGVLSQECPEYQRHHLNGASYVIELLDLENDQPVAAGELGRVVVTDLFSYGMPLVRYEMGDVAAASEGPCKCGRPGPTFAELLGRQVENVSAPDGRLVSWVRINDSMWDFPKVRKFQFVQFERSQYEMRVVLDDRSESVQEIENVLVAILGSGADVTVKPVESIDRSRSGKQPYIINRYNSRTQ